MNFLDGAQKIEFCRMPNEGIQRMKKTAKRKSKKKFATNFLLNIFKMIEVN